jgi:hypothetical protein
VPQKFHYPPCQPHLPEIKEKEVQAPKTDSTSLSKENLRSRVYTLMRDVAKVPFASPSKLKRLSSNFEASCGLIWESSSTYNSFPESNHVLGASNYEVNSPTLTK